MEAQTPMRINMLCNKVQRAEHKCSSTKPCARMGSVFSHIFNGKIWQLVCWTSTDALRNLVLWVCFSRQKCPFKFEFSSGAGNSNSVVLLSAQAVLFISPRICHALHLKELSLLSVLFWGT